MVRLVNIPPTRLGRAWQVTLGLILLSFGLPAWANQEPSPSEGALERILQKLEDGLRKGDPRDCSRIEQVARTLEEAPLKLQKLRAWCTLNGATRLPPQASEELQQLLNNQDQEASFLSLLLDARSSPKSAALRLETAWFEAPLSWDGLWYLRTRALLKGTSSPYSPDEQKLLRKRLPSPTFKRYHSPSYDPATTLSRLQRLSPSKGRLRQELTYAMARLALVQDNSQKALTQLAQIRRPQAHPSLVPWTHIAKGMALWRRAAYRDGQRAFQFAIRSGNERARHIASGEAGRMAIAFRKFKDARAHFQAQLFENPLGTGRDEALWGLGWVAYRTGQYDEARQYFDNLFNESPYGPKAAASLFWAAQSAMRLGLEELAFSEWMALIERFPTTYYASRAQARVYERPDLGIRVAAATLAEPTRPKALSDAYTLLQSNQPQAAIKVLYKWLPDARSFSSPKHLQLGIDLATKAGDRNLAGKLSGILGRTYPFNHPNAARILGSNFRSPHLGLMQRKAAQRGIPVDVIIGLSRQESALNPNAVSPVGALGLMQLMPATAQSMAPKGRTWSRKDVLNPAINIPLGVRYLKAMLKEFDGQIEYALAAYNAGPGAANRWRRRYKGEEIEVFVEEIPYDETRQYVHKVFSWRLKYKYYESLIKRASESKTEAKSSKNRL